MIIGGMIDSPKERDMPNDLTDGVGFVSPDVRTGAAKRRFARAELIATVALAVCLVVALTAVSIGMARADTLGIIAETENGRLALAIMLGPHHGRHGRRHGLDVGVVRQGQAGLGSVLN
jgi:hypothetical protein